MHEIVTACADFWGRFFDISTGKNIPAFPDGKAYVAAGRKTVPASFPYITYPILRPRVRQNAIGIASVWDRRDDQTFINLVTDALGQIAVAIPEEGSFLKVGATGSLWILRGDPFQSIMTDPSDDAITRGVINFVIRGYIL